MNFTTKIMGLALALAAAAPAIAQTTAPGLPDTLRKVAIATQDDEHGKIAGAPIGNTGYYVVYMRTEFGCGSGGCPAKIWKREGANYVLKDNIRVGFLPIVTLPQSDRGMPRLGVTGFNKATGKAAIYPVLFDGQGWGGQIDQPLPVGSGTPLLTEAMLKAF